MRNSDNFEMNRRERRRRERLRKKRIRMAVCSIAAIGIIALGAVTVSSIIRKNNTETGNIAANNGNEIIDIAGQEVQLTPAPDAQAQAPVEAPQAAVSQIPAPDEENNLLEILSNSGQKKVAYLTFDDGPTDNITPQVLDVLRRYNVKATFFEVGKLIEANPDIARRVYEEGHLIANHSNGHDYDTLYATEESFINEVLDCEDKIRNITDGEEPFKLIRFPGGSYNAGDHAAEKQIYKETLRANGFYYADWNSLNGDAEGAKKDADGLYQYFLNSSSGYNNLVVLMHDAATKQATVDALPRIIEYLLQNGYTFKRLDEINYAPASTADGTVQAESSDTVSAS